MDRHSASVTIVSPECCHLTGRGCCEHITSVLTRTPLAVYNDMLTLSSPCYVAWRRRMIKNSDSVLLLLIHGFGTVYQLSCIIQTMNWLIHQNISVLWNARCWFHFRLKMTHIFVFCFGRKWTFVFSNGFVLSRKCKTWFWLVYAYQMT